MKFGKTIFNSFVNVKFLSFMKKLLKILGQF